MSLTCRQLSKVLLALKSASHTGIDSEAINAAISLLVKQNEVRSYIYYARSCSLKLSTLAR